MTDGWDEVPMSPIKIQPKPAACENPTISSFVVRLTQEVWGEDRGVVVERSCGHSYNWSARRDPVVGEPALTCLGPQPETQRSGRAEPTLPPMKKGRRWTVVKPGKVA